MEVEAELSSDSAGSHRAEPWRALAPDQSLPTFAFGAAASSSPTSSGGLLLGDLESSSHPGHPTQGCLPCTWAARALQCGPSLSLEAVTVVCHMQCRHTLLCSELPAFTPADGGQTAFKIHSERKHFQDSGLW